MRLPLGFTSEEHFKNILRRVRAAADFFLVSDILHQHALTQGANDANGALRVGATQRYFPALAAIERELSQEVGRKTTIRIFSRAGYDRVEAETDILGE